MTGAEEHAHLVALIGDVFRGGLDDARVHLPPRAERTVIERAVELLELAGYTLTRAEPEPEPEQIQVW